MPSSSPERTNGAKLIRLIIDEGTDTMRKYFDSKCPPATLTAILTNHKTKLNYLHTNKGVITDKQMNLLFPPAGMSQSKSKNYDITLLFVLIRTICGLTPPASTGWNKKPLSSDTSEAADLIRIKLYRNQISHIASTEVSHRDFISYWNEISEALVRLSRGVNAEDIVKLMASPIDEDYYIRSVTETRDNNTQTTTYPIPERSLMTSPIDEDHHIRSVTETRNNNAQTTTYPILERSFKAVIFITLLVSTFWVFQLFLYQKEDYPMPQIFSSPSFVGREWVFRQMEEILNASGTRGVLLVAEPGWGKSAIMKQLISSSSSSAVIHENFIGHHVCKFNDKSTRDGGRFVKNLVQLIGNKIREYRKILNKDQLVQDILNSNCNDNPVECFKTAIVGPLQNLDRAGRENSFILIDALDECMEKEETHQSIIVNILIDKVPDLPNWVKLIVTSRNHPMSTSKMVRTVKLWNLTIDVNDKRDEQDLHTYANRTLQSFLTETSSNEEILRIQNLTAHAVKFCKGNFLFLETIMNNWKKDPDKINADSIPESLEDIYAKSFTRRFKEDNLVRFEPFLEILLAAYSPLTFIELEKILDYHFHEKFSARKVANALSEYLKADIDQGPLEFHHQFFAEWLVNQTKGIAGIVIKKSRGHQYIFDYLLNDCEKKQTNLTMKELSELFAQFLHGKETTQSNLRRLGSLKVSEIRGYRKRCLLHDLALKQDATELLVEFVKQFNSVDILDDDGWTPAMYAVKAGNYENVKFFIDNKTNLDYVIERKFCITACLMFTEYLRFDEDVQIYNVISLAAYEGHFDIIHLLIQRGANIETTNKCGWKPLHFAAMMGHFEIAKLFIDRGAQPDVLSLHHAAATNHTEIARLFLVAGVRDECLSCKSENKSWCAANINRFHLCICETALYAAVSRNTLEMVELILQYGNTSVNCRHGSGRTALMEAFSQKNIQMVKLLINAGADINAECKSPLSQLMYDCYDGYNSLYIRYYKQPVCDGNHVIDFSFAYGLWKVMIPFISKGKLNISSDNAMWNSEMVAVIYDRVDIINATYGYSMESIPNIETVLRYAVVCHSVKTLEHLLYSQDESKFTTVYEDGKTLLHFAILGSVESQTKVYMTHSCPSSSCICPKIVHADIVKEKRLETVMLLTKVLTSDINKQDKYGRTALHYATVQVLPEIVKCLISKGADWSVRDQRGDTALEYALRERPHMHEIFLPCQWTGDRVFAVCQSTVFDELVSYLLRYQTITECDGRAKTLLNGLLYHRLPLSLYSLFKSGLDVNCSYEHFIRYLNPTLFNAPRRERDDVLEIFKIFRINIQVRCGVPFRQSVLHLMSYMGKHSQVGNLFKPSENKDIFPLQRFFANHPKGVGILNECYDKEGYLPIHRAVQGDNTFAFSWFIEIGVDITRKTKSGFTIFVLAIRRLLDDYSNISEFREDYILQQILKITKEKNLTHAFSQCNSDISPLHVAAAKLFRAELLQLFTILNPKQLLTCTNSDGIQPIYLSYLYYQNRWFYKKALLNLGLSPENERPVKYPEREVEYHLIYNMLYHTPQDDLKNVPNNDCLFKCPGINHLLPNKTEIQEHLKLCSRHCWPSAFEASRKFLSNFPHLDIQNNISNPFSDKFMDIAAHIAELRFHLVKTFPFFSMSLEKYLWQKVTKAHSCAFRCSCFEMMKLLQEKFTSRPLEWWDSEHSYSFYVGSFLFERMGWIKTSRFGDVRYRWPFRFLLKKALKKDKAYNYLQILNPNRGFSPLSDI